MGQKKQYYALKKAFTLSEVLITLVIIGVIAAITVPMLNQNTNKQEMITKLKKTFSTLSQATDQIIMEEGPATEWATSQEKIYNLYVNHLRLTKDCGTGRGCFPDVIYQTLSGTPITNFNRGTSWRRFILADGIPVQIGNVAVDGCNFTESNLDMGSNNVCATITVDINGEKGPHQIGRDFFMFVIKENGLYPAGCDKSSLCDKTKWGYACTCQAVMDGNLDY